MKSNHMKGGKCRTFSHKQHYKMVMKISLISCNLSNYFKTQDFTTDLSKIHHELCLINFNLNDFEDKGRSYVAYT